PVNSACPASCTQNYPQFLWIPSAKRHSTPLPASNPPFGGWFERPGVQKPRHIVRWIVECILVEIHSLVGENFARHDTGGRLADMVAYCNVRSGAGPGHRTLH